MSTSFPMSFQIIDMGASSWCWTQLGAGGEGMLSFEDQRGRLSLAVLYAVTDAQISIPLASPDAVGWRAAGAETCLEVRGVTSDDVRWVVRATGTAEQADRSGSLGLARCRQLHPSNGRSSSAASSDRLHLRKPRVRGFYRTSVVV
jgi:hypothetical protein